MPAREQHAVEVVERRLGDRGSEERELHTRSLADRPRPARALSVDALRLLPGRPFGPVQPGLEPSGAVIGLGQARAAGTASWAGTEPIEILRRFDTVTAATMIANATTAMTARSGADALSPRLN